MLALKIPFRYTLWSEIRQLELSISRKGATYLARQSEAEELFILVLSCVATRAYFLVAMFECDEGGPSLNGLIDTLPILLRRSRV